MLTYESLMSSLGPATTYVTSQVVVLSRMTSMQVLNTLSTSAGTTYSCNTQSQLETFGLLAIQQSTTYIDPTDPLSTNTLTAAPVATEVSTLVASVGQTNSISGTVLEIIAASVGGTTFAGSQFSSQYVNQTLGVSANATQTSSFLSQVTSYISSAFTSSSVTLTAGGTTFFTTTSSTGSSNMAAETVVIVANGIGITTSETVVTASGRTINGVGGSTSGSGSVSVTATSAGTFTIAAATTTYSTSTTIQDTIGATLTSSYPESTIATLTGTTTGIPSTTSTTSSSTTSVSVTYTALTTQTDTATTSLATVLSTTAAFTAAIGTVAVADSTDWGWFMTTTGQGPAESIGASFTQTTFGPVLVLESQLATTIKTTAAPPFQTFTITTWTTNSTPTTLTNTTSASVSYVVGTATTGTNGVPFGTASSSMSVTTTTSSTYTIASLSSATTTTYAYSGHTSSGLQGFSYVTTWNGTTVTTYSTWSFTDSVLVFTLQTINSTRTVGGTSSTATLVTSQTEDGATAGFNSTLQSPVNVSLAPSPAWLDATLPAGWQVQGSSGAGEPIGSNLGGGASVTETALAWPDISTPVLGTANTYTFTDDGAQVISESMSHSRTRLGGISWNSSSTILTVGPGILRQTTADSFSVTSTTESTCDTSNSTIRVAIGEGLAFESVPLCGSTTASTTAVPFLNFPAFPPTSA